VVRLGAPLPGRDAGAMDRLVIFDGATVVRGLAALKIFPLRAGEQTVGALVCGSRRRDGLPSAAQSGLAMLALQAAEALLRARLYEQAERLATTDGLTGLFNRRALDEHLSARFAEAVRYQRPLSFVLLDIDHFKKVNDNHGHPAGDAVLRGVAEVLAGQARATDRAARYGGEEMALLLPETDLAGALVIAERARAAVERASHDTESGALSVTASFGVSSVPAAGIGTPAQLLEAADQALYRAKQGGRNRVETARPVTGAAAGLPVPSAPVVPSGITAA
jgi:diguanylate cyclase (GGDEF)-like protein